MPNIKSAKKRVEVSNLRRLRNMSIKSAVKGVVKKFETLLSNAKIDDAQASLHKTLKVLDKAVSNGIMHKNAAARKKSRLTKKLNKLTAL